MSTSNHRVPIECAECGLKLGLGSPGAWVSCARCGCWAAARASRGDAGAVVGAAVAVGAGLAAAAIIASLLRGRR